MRAVTDPAVEALRQQLRERGYLTHGIERWFALDPWSSRAFWVELAVVAFKAALVVAIFGALPPLAVMLFRNAGNGVLQGATIFALYAAVELAFGFAMVVALALGLKLRPSIAVDTPAALLAISMVTAAILLAPIAIWWSGFDAPAEARELFAAGVLAAIFFVVATVTVSAAMLSFSIYELKRIPAIHRRPRWSVIALVALAVGGVIGATATSHQEPDAPEPMIVVRPTQERLALVAVDGMTEEIFRSRPDLVAILPHESAARAIPSLSAAERWASVGTGVPPELHGVRSIDGIRLAGSTRVLQRVSRWDPVLRNLAAAIRLARREPLPPTARKRDYVWESFARRGITAAAVNWWATTDTSGAGLSVAGPESIFSGSGGNPLAVDSAAARRAIRFADTRRPQFVTVYLPALDVVLNRRAIDRSQQLALSIRALDGVRDTISALRARRYDIVLLGLPGEGQSGRGVIAATMRLAHPASAWDVAPTVADLFGFPLAEEMPGNSLTGMPQQARVVSYGARHTSGASPAVNREYYESLKSLGYIQ